ncbi:MAG: Bug family tripartite tricarboxylate transporter substrate binding protein, partial [Burkholderiales bacterium]
LGVSLALVKGGKLKLLGVATPKRMAALPDVPTIAETALPGFEAVLRYGFVAPPGTPPAIIARLHAALNTALANPDVRARLAVDGAEPQGSTPEEFAALIRSELEKWGRVTRAAGIEAQ